MTSRSLSLVLASLASLAVFAGACSGSKSGGGTPTIVLGSSGVANPVINVAIGHQVTFKNLDAVAHQIQSTDCSELNGPVIVSGTSWTATVGNIVEGCHYRATAATTGSFTGTINVVASTGGGGGGGWIVGASSTLARGQSGVFSLVNAPATADFFSIFCVSPAGWVVGANGTVLYTADDGDHWIAESSGITSALRAVAFADASQGLAVGDGGVVLRTTDAGAHWTPVASGVSVALRAVDFAEDGLHAWIAGDAGTLLTSIDGGQNWAPAAAGVPAAAALTGIRFAADDATRGVAIGAGGLVLLTTDAGQHWTAGPALSADLAGLQVDATGKLVIVVGAGGFVGRSTTFGASFVQIPTGTTRDLTAIGFSDDHVTAFVTGRAGTLLRTSDQGVHLGPMQSPTVQDLWSSENER